MDHDTTKKNGIKLIILARLDSGDLKDIKKVFIHKDYLTSLNRKVFDRLLFLVFMITVNVRLMVKKQTVLIHKKGLTYRRKQVTFCAVLIQNEFR